MTLAKCLQKPEGMAALHAELAAGGETDAAMAFLATAIKDHGAVPASNSLYRSAHRQHQLSTCADLSAYLHQLCNLPASPCPASDNKCLGSFKRRMDWTSTDMHSVQVL